MLTMKKGEISVFKMKLNNVNALAMEGKDIETIFISNLSKFKKYVKENFCPHIDIEPSLALDLIFWNGNSYIGFDSDLILEAFCKLLNIRYDNRLEEQEKFGYYTLQLNAKIQELQTIKDENELCGKFYKIYALYQEKKEKMAEALDIYYTYSRVFPMTAAKQMQEIRLHKAGIRREEYAALLNESFTFNLQSFLDTTTRELNLMVSHLPYLVNSLMSMSINTSTLKGVDTKIVDEMLGIEREQETENTLVLR